MRRRLGKKESASDIRICEKSHLLSQTRVSQAGTVSLGCPALIVVQHLYNSGGVHRALRGIDDEFLFATVATIVTEVCSHSETSQHMYLYLPLSDWWHANKPTLKAGCSLAICLCSHGQG